MKQNLKPKITLIAHNLRSCHNIGSLFRTAEGLGVSGLYLTGYSPYPRQDNDSRLPHLSAKITKQISKTALGADKTLKWEHNDDVSEVILYLRANGYKICALEQESRSIDIRNMYIPEKVALLVGREVEGVEKEVLNLCDQIIEIPMLGEKESFNVSQVSAMALFFLRYMSQ